MLMVGIPKSRQPRGNRGRDLADSDRAALDRIFAAAPLCHLGYVQDGMPAVTQAHCWRDATHFYLMAARASRQLKEDGLWVSVSLTVPRNDAQPPSRFVLDCHTNCRSAALFGRAHVLSGTKAKLAALSALIERAYPGRPDKAYRPDAKQIKATAILRLNLDEAFIEVKDEPRADDMAILGCAARMHEVRSAPGTRHQQRDAGGFSPAEFQPQHRRRAGSIL